jgi:outer membrane protein assembly factor BamD
MRATVRRVAVLAMLAGAIGCAGKQAVVLKGADEYFAEGKRALDKKHYPEAIEKLQRVVTNYPGATVVGDAQFYLAEAHFRSKDYVNAVFEYQRLLDNYPSSAHVAEAQYQIGEASYQQRRRPELDQKETLDALNQFRRFLDDNPDSPLAERARQRVADCRAQLGHKLYLGGRLYQRQKHPEAAESVFREVMRAYPDTPWYYEALYQIGEIALAKEDAAQARACWREVVQDAKDQELVRKARTRLSALEAPPGG